MNLPRQTEPSANNALAELLRGMLHAADIRSENTRAIAGKPAFQPDIIVSAPDRAPVVVEAEFMPAYNAEQEAIDRLGLRLAQSGKTIEAAIALRYPEAVPDAADLHAAIAAARLSYCVHTLETEPGETEAGETVPARKRFPESGWLEGGVSDVADLIRLVSVSQSAVNAASALLERGIERAVGTLDDLAETSPVVVRQIADALGMSDVPQTRRMACAVIANAMVFHDRIAAMHAEIQPLNLLWRSDADNPQGKITHAWDAVLNINYWPIFAVARDIVNLLPSRDAARILTTLRSTAQRINSTGASFAHDLTGRIFQRLISDRKYLATFYTLPASAALLARLAVEKLQSVPSPSTGKGRDGDGRTIDWADPAAIANLKVGDFACGTGALLSAVYEQIANKHERAGGDPAALHTAMMEDVLYGCDVMPSAIHITGSTLSGMQPNIGYGSSRLYAMPYGRQQDGSVAIGSLELLQASSVLTLFNMSDPALRTGSAGAETASQVIADIPDNSFDIVIMNPPFTSNTKHYDADDGVLNAAFAAFDSSRNEQDDMASRLKEKTRDTCYHGHAGLGSAFAALAHRKLRPGGIVAFVLPFTAINGASWAKFRELIATHYTDTTIVSIAANGKEMSFSSDTGMAECLIIGRKLVTNEGTSQRSEFISLRRKPANFVHALELANGMSHDTEVRQIEDGPYGGNSIYCGEELAGELLIAPTDDYKNGWGSARIADVSVAQTAHALSNGKLWLPTDLVGIDMNMAQLKDVGQRGLHHGLIAVRSSGGPFDRATPSQTSTYPAMWNHNNKNEKRIVCEPDSQLRVRQGMEEKAATVWARASRSHLNAEYTFGAQPLGVAFTERKSMGGRVWPNVLFDDEQYDYAFAVWGNSTLGLLSYWWHSSRQQSSKAGMTVTAVETLPILDLCALTDEQHGIAKDIFDEFRERDLKPAYLADADPNRALLDWRVVCDMLGFGEDVYEGVRLLAAKWCAEPSVHGGKRRPRRARLVV
ncbi:MAG: hypothetical protein F4Y44_03675 [Chloroflexi bacterium]|nr:hypothetical protein [Chloroflexota bacterium]